METDRQIIEPREKFILIYKLITYRHAHYFVWSNTGFVEHKIHGFRIYFEL